MISAHPGRFITLEGGEGAGKTTLGAALQAQLRGRGFTVLTTREPGGTPAAEQIRRVLVSDDSVGFAPLTEALLFTAARHEHVAQVIRPALSRGDWVICDRYLDSTAAYQAAAGGVPQSVCAALASMINAPAPDLTLLLDLEPAHGLNRSGGRARGEDRFERRSPAFHQAVRDAFLRIARKDPRRVTVIAADQPPEIVLDQVMQALQARGWL